MPKPKSITPPAGAFYVTITDYYLRIADGNATAAALLKLYENRHNQILSDLVKSGKQKATFADFQQQSSGAFLRKCLMNIYSAGTIKKANDLLVERGFIQIFRNFADGEKLPNTVVFMVANVQKAIDLGTSNLTKGYSNLSKGLVKFEQGGYSNLTIELSVLESINLERESKDFLILKDDKIPALQDVILYAKSTNQPEQKAIDFYTTNTANNWQYKGSKINDWKAFFDGYTKRVFNGEVRTKTTAEPQKPIIPKREYF